jgi:hypothetical protein
MQPGAIQVVVVIVVLFRFSEFDAVEESRWTSVVLKIAVRQFKRRSPNFGVPVAYCSHMADLGNSIGEVGGVIRTMLGLTRHSRTRNQIQANVDLYASMIPHPNLGEASSDLAEVIIEQTRHLREVSFDTGRAWDWGAWSVSWLIMAGSAYVSYLFRSELAKWWAITLFALFSFNAVLFFIVGLGVLLQRKPTNDDRAPQHDDEVREENVRAQTNL